ncbi:hypothetical protein FB451DRAFT_1028404, partial [Mycena latifolia]
ASGIAVCVFLQAMYLLISDPPRRKGKRSIPLIVYTFVLFALDVVFVAMDLNDLKLGFVDNRNAPGGPTAYALSRYGEPLTALRVEASVYERLLADGLLLYRCVIIFHLNFAIVALPILMYLGSIVMSIIVLYQASRPNAHLWTRLTVDFGIPYYTLSAALNVLITIMITTRLLIYRRAIRKALGDEQALSVPYASIAAMLVESSALYAVTSILFLVPYAVNSDVSNIFLPILVQVQLLAPLLIILRVAKRRAWDESTATAAPASNLKFQNFFPPSGHYTENNIEREMGNSGDVVSSDSTRMQEPKQSVNKLTSSSAMGARET